MEDRLRTIDRFLADKIIWFILSCVALGVLFPDFFSFLVPFTPFLFAIMTFCNTLGCSFRQMGGILLHPLPILTALLLLHVVMPSLCLVLCKLLFPHAPLFTTGLVLNFALPTGVISLMWVSIAKGNLPMCLSIVLLDTLLSPLVVPLTLKVLLGSMVEMDAMGMMLDLVYMVAIPALAALLCHNLRHGQTAAVWKPRLSPFSKVIMFTIVISNASGVAPFLRDFTFTLALVVVVLIGLICLSYYLGYLTARKILKLDYPSSQTMTLNAGLRNISAGAVLASQYFPADVLFPVAFSPIFTQVLLSMVVKLLHKTKAWQEEEAKPSEE